ncbi:MAG: hypothetical protein JSU85_03980 [Candidatus Zixiibacteriota bacterium]|nr:MAG: hypothetical protein JSU85_03980 [candidate division Zixibacteria bacterium]
MRDDFGWLVYREGKLGPESVEKITLAEEVYAAPDSSWERIQEHNCRYDPRFIDVK